MLCFRCWSLFDRDYKPFELVVAESWAMCVPRRGLCARGVVMSGRRMKWSVFDDIVVVE